MTGDERRRALDAIAGEVATCTRCRLHQARTKAVPGEGHPDTEVVFVGEGPGFNEDRQGRPFVGQAGNLLEELLLRVGWSRKEVFIANVVKCRPPENRDPEPDEIAACAPFLTRQLEVLDPALVVTLGRYSMARFNPGAKISQIHGTYKEPAANSGAGDALVYFMYHPAAALRDSGVKEQSYRDMAGVPAALTEARARRAARRAATSTATPAANEPATPPATATAGSGMVSEAQAAEDAQLIATSISTSQPERAATPAAAPDPTLDPTTSTTALDSIPSLEAAIHDAAGDGETMPTDQLGLF